MIFSAIILIACTINLGCSVTLELYSGQHYSGLVKKITLDEYEELRCTQFDQNYEVRSLKTDKCVIIYETGDCKHIDVKAPADWTMYSVRVERDTGLFDITGAYANRKEERSVRSFHVCTRRLGGGSTLDVDIYDSPNYSPGELIASYGGVCNCKNLQSRILTKRKQFSIDNHGNNMYFYDKEDCSGLERFIPAGDNERSRSVFQFDPHSEVIRSFRPVDGLSCPPDLDAEAYWFDFFNGSKTGGITEDIQQYLTTTVANTRPSAATVYFNTSIPTTVKYSVAKAFTYVHTTRVAITEHNMGFDDGITVLLGGNTKALKRSMEANYQYTNTHQSTETMDVHVSIPAQDQGSIDMTACQTCELTYFVRRFPISYTAFVLLTGDDKMSQRQLIDILPPGMEKADTGSNGHIYVKVEGEMKADLYVRDHTKTFCKSVPDCKPN